MAVKKQIFKINNLATLHQVVSCGMSTDWGDEGGVGGGGGEKCVQSVVGGGGAVGTCARHANSHVCHIAVRRLRK